MKIIIVPVDYLSDTPEDNAATKDTSDHLELYLNAGYQIVHHDTVHNTDGSLSFVYHLYMPFEKTAVDDLPF